MATIADTSRQVIYLYDLPRSIATSIRVNQIIKERCGLEIQEPVQFRDARPHAATGLPSPYCIGIIKVDPAEFKKVAESIKYFEMTDGSKELDGSTKAWQCRGLPFDRDLLGPNKVATNLRQNIFVSNIPKDVTAGQLEELFKDIAQVKSAKISTAPVFKVENVNGRLYKHIDISVPPVSNGYGFVCFNTAEEAQKALNSKVGDLKLEQFKQKERNDASKIFNNIYVKNYNPAWKEADLRELFSNLGDIKSIAVMEKIDKDGTPKPFAFVCFDRPTERTYGPECAQRAVNDLHDKEIDGFKLYVQPALPAPQRQAQVLREQQRFKNSKKKCNLFVKGFPSTFTEENLRNLFGHFGEIESIRILPTQDGQPSSRAFVCFKQPDVAATARSNLHNQIIEGKHLFVTNYELPEIRKKIQADAKDKADFLNMKRQTAAPIDPSLLQRPDTIQLIQQILTLIQRNIQRPQYQMRPQNGQYNNNRPGQPRNNGVPGGAPGQPRAPSQRPQANNPVSSQPIPIVDQQQPAPQVEIVSASGARYLANPDPKVNAYNQKGFSYIPAVFPENPNLKQMVGEFIYPYVEEFVGEALAPKITGMLIDLPIDEIKGYLYDYGRLYFKIGEAVALLQQLQAQQAPPQGSQ